MFSKLRVQLINKKRRKKEIYYFVCLSSRRSLFLFFSILLLSARASSSSPSNSSTISKLDFCFWNYLRFIAIVTYKRGGIFQSRADEEDHT